MFVLCVFPLPFCLVPACNWLLPVVKSFYKFITILLLTVNTEVSELRGGVFGKPAPYSEGPDPNYLRSPTHTVAMLQQLHRLCNFRNIKLLQQLRHQLCFSSPYLYVP